MIISSKWVHGVVLGVEGLEIYNLVKEINIQARHMTENEIVVHAYNKKYVMAS